MPNIDINGTVIAFPEGMTPDQLNAAAAKAAQQLGQQTQHPLDPSVVNEPGVQPASVLSDIQRGAAQGLGATGALMARPTSAGLQEASGIAQGQPAQSVQGKIGKFVGEAVSPASLAIGAGIGKTMQAGAPIVKALAPGARAEAGAAVGAAEAAGGIEQKIATVSDLADRWGLGRGKRNLASLVNTAKGKIVSGEKMAPQDLSDIKDLIAEEFKAGRVAEGTKKYAIFSDVSKKVGGLMNEAMPGRASASANYAQIMKVRNVMDKLAMSPAAKKAIEYALLGVGIGYGAKKLGR